MKKIKEILVKQIFSDAFEEMLNNCEDFVKEQVLIEKSRIFADGYYKALDDVLEVIDETFCVASLLGITNSRVVLEMLVELKDKFLALKGEQNGN